MGESQMTHKFVTQGSIQTHTLSFNSYSSIYTAASMHHLYCCLLRWESLHYVQIKNRQPKSSLKGFH